MKKVYLFACGNLGIILFICDLFNKVLSASALNIIMVNDLWINYVEGNDHDANFSKHSRKLKQ
jgi:hypothetical protein